MTVELDDLAVALGRATPAPDTIEAQQWEMWIGDALMLIGARHDLDELDSEMLDYVVREAVVAHIRRPDDATTVDVSVDDARASRTYRSSAGRVTIIPEWWALLSPKTSAGAWSIRPEGGGPTHMPWCSAMFGANYCSCGVDIAGRPIYEGADL